MSNPSTLIKYSIKERVNLNISVYNLQGRKVAELYNGMQNKGEHDVAFDASMLSSGVYFVKLVTDDFVRTKKIMFVK